MRDEKHGGLRHELMNGWRQLPRVGEVLVGSTPVLPYVVVDGLGEEVEPVCQFLRDRSLSDVSPLTCRSYGYDLLRWFRLLWLLEVSWDRATEAEVAVLVGWMRHADNEQRRRRPDAPQPGSINPVTGKAEPSVGYAAATRAHAVTVVSEFYDFHLHFGRGPVVNPVPKNPRRREVLAHRSPLEPVGSHRRGRLRPKATQRPIRAIPDRLFDELFARMSSVRDRALLAFYVSSGARASELLGLRLEDIDWAGRRIHVISKGSRLRQAVPASPDAFVYLASYLDKAGVPAPRTPLWRTMRGPARPLTYWAMRQVLERANASLGTNWTLHDLRHTTAARLAADPDITLVEVQTIMRHAHLTTTQLYTQVALDDLIDKVGEHYARPRAQRQWSATYDPDDLRTVFGAP